MSDFLPWKIISAVRGRVRAGVIKLPYSLLHRIFHLH